MICRDGSHLFLLPKQPFPRRSFAYTVQNQAVILPSYKPFEYSPFVKNIYADILNRSLIY